MGYPTIGVKPNIERMEKRYRASHDLLGHRMVVLTSNDYVEYAEHTNLSHSIRLIGITKNTAAIGCETDIITFGEVIDASWNWDTNKPIFLGAAGELIQEQPATGFSLVVGFPSTNQKAWIRIGLPIILAS